MLLGSASFSHRGAIRDHNEDALLEATAAGVWVVADGMGGYQAGDVASQLVCDSVAGAVSRGAMPPGSLADSLALANRRIHQYGSETLQGQTLGTTVVALQLQEGRFHLYWAGDSRCYRLRRGQLLQLSHDHSQVAEMVDQGLLRPSEAEGHPLSHIVTRALGVERQVELEYRSGEVLAGDRFLLCSDGISKEFSQHQLEAFLAVDDIEEAARALLHSALVNKCDDNVTCIIVNVKSGCYSPASSTRDEDETVRVDRRFMKDHE